MLVSARGRSHLGSSHVASTRFGSRWRSFFQGVGSALPAIKVSNAMLFRSVIASSTGTRPVGRAIGYYSRKSDPVLRVLIVGCGCSGSLVAKYTRDFLKQQGAGSWDGLPKQSHRKQVVLERHVDLTLWDWARGPAGRMATYYSSADGGQMYTADVGAQVLSAGSPTDEEYLRSCGAVDAFGLAPTTCERPHDAVHFWMPAGLTQLLSMHIKASKPDEVAFNRRVLSVTRDGQHCSVEAELDSPPHWLARGEYRIGRYQPEHGQSVLKQDFDAVVMAVSAHDVLRVHGLAGVLGSRNVASLKKVAYDSRLSVAFVLSPELASSLESLFSDGQSELDFECGTRACTEGVLGLLAWQDRKARDHDGCTVVVAHSTRLFAKDNLSKARLSRQKEEDRGLIEVTRALALQLQMSQELLESLTLDAKVIHWRQAQVQRFMAGSQDCLVAPDGETKLPKPLLLLCGDYFTEATFSGCARSARAAATALMEWLQTRLAV